MEQNIKDFLDNYAPGNHWSSKSMELSRNEDKGTYWYLKKFVTFYYYVFIQKKLDRDGLRQISAIFENYCNSVPEEARDKAFSFFFERDLRKIDEIITLNEYLFNTDAIANDSADMDNARKYYFSYLLNIDEQNPEKELIFTTTIAERNYIKGIKLAKDLFEDKEKFKKLVPDVHAFLRNQRQILYVLGLVNYTKINNKEEYAPTDIGKHIVFANYNEMILLLEIQKLRQVSRNPLVIYSEDYNRPRNRQIKENADKTIINKGHICSHPYLVLLRYLINNKELSTKNYMFIVSRLSNLHNLENCVKLTVENVDVLPIMVNNKDKEYYTPGSNSGSDDFVLRPEDFSKEYKKYVQGIFSVDADYNSNLLSIGKLGTHVCKISNLDKASALYKNYFDIVKYLDDVYNAIYENIDNVHNKKYATHINRGRYNYKNPIYLAAVEDWLNYFVSSDTNIIRMMLKTVSEMNGLQKQNIKKIYPYLCEQVLKVKTAQDIENMFKNTALLEIETPVVVVRNKVTENMLITESKKYLNIMNDFTLERKRNVALRDQYASFKMQHNHDICEICGNKLAKEVNGNYICNYHHILPFNEAGALGPDHYLNLIGICSNCHDKLHSKITCNERKEMYNAILINSCFTKDVFERILKMYKDGYLFNASLEYAVAMGMITESQKIEIINSRS